jgi:hypothetical protein
VGEKTFDHLNDGSRDKTGEDASAANGASIGGSKPISKTASDYIKALLQQLDSRSASTVA